jgi:hypothetical protein
MARDYHAEYEARNELARERGFDSYNDERRLSEALRDSPGRMDYFEEVFGTRDWKEVADEGGAAAYYNAFIDPVSAHEARSSDSARAYWFVEVTGDVESFEEWEELYGDDT